MPATRAWCYLDVGYMNESERRGFDAFRTVIRSLHLSRADDIPTILSEAAGALGAVRGMLYIIDFDQLELVPLHEPGTLQQARFVTVDGSMAGRCFRDVVVLSSTGTAGTTAWAPVVNGTERLGVLELHFAEPSLDDGMLEACRDLGSLVADLVLSRNMYGDMLQRARRRDQMSIPAEMQWHQLPPLTFVSSKVAVAGVLAPTHDVAGDSFDYAVNGDTAHVAIVDAMGHGLEATLLSSVALGAYRNARRSGYTLADTVRIMDRQIAEHFGGDKFVTAVVGELHCQTGFWTWISCGHPTTLLIREGQVVKELDQVGGVPLGLGMLRPGLEVGEEHLQPGDRLLLYTDGVVEARDRDGDEFGVARLADFVSRESVTGRAAAETMRRLNLAILDHQEGELQDDATTVMVEWLKPDVEADVPTG